MKKLILIIAAAAVSAGLGSCRTTSSDEDNDKSSSNDTTDYRLKPKAKDDAHGADSDEKTAEDEDKTVVEEVVKSQQATEIRVVDNYDNNIRSADERYCSPSQHDYQGYDDLNKSDVIHEVVEVTPKVESKSRDENIFHMAMVEQTPTFKGGDAALYKWLNSQIVYPADASQEGAQGKVIVEFVIEKDGSVSNVRVVRKKHPSLDAEAVRVVRKMPNWVPGRNNGQTVRVRYTLPVTFRLQS